MSDSTKTKFSTNIIAITGLISAIGGVITVLYNTGVLGSKQVHTTIQEKSHEVIYQKKESNIKKKAQVKEENEVNYVDVVFTKESLKRTHNLTGYWIDINNPNGRYYIDFQEADLITFTEYSLVLGVWVVTANGSGNIHKNRITIPYKTYVGTMGKFSGKVLKNGNRINGSIQDYHAGITAPLNLQKQE